jgi:hypothetical protein
MDHEQTALTRSAQAGGAGASRKPLGYTRARTIVVVLGCIMSVALTLYAFNLRMTQTTPVTVASTIPLATKQPQPALTRAEEAYLQALWPVHTEVEIATARMSLGVILYNTNDIPETELKARAEMALASYQHAAARIADLPPPDSLKTEHETYLAAVQLFQSSTVEALKTFDDGDEDHLLASYKLRQEGADKIREVGGRFWRDEFPPN